MRNVFRAKIFWLCVFLFTCLLHAKGFGLTFTNTTFKVGNGPQNVAVADVDGDGTLDLISPDYGLGNGNTLTILTNNGQGVFGSNTTFILHFLTNGLSSLSNSVPLRVVAADFNGNGKTDLIIEDPQNRMLVLLTNNGSGGFGFNTKFNDGKNFGPVLATDINGDGKLDLIYLNYNTNTLTVLTNNGSGAFGFNATFFAGSTPMSVAATDINGDGKADLIVANYVYTAPTLTVLTNNGSGILGSNATITVGYAPDCVVAADINNDGQPDLISANFEDNTLSVLTNNGRGAYVTSATLPTGISPNCVVAADVNGDGKMDLISANLNTTNTLTILTNNGSGGFGFNTTLIVGGNPSWAVAADFNGDGKIDLVSANWSGGRDGSLTVLINTSTFPPPTSVPQLTMKSRLNEATITWPADSPGWSLLQSPDLTRQNWLPSGLGGWPITNDATNHILTIPFQTGSVFFRLMHP